MDSVYCKVINANSNLFIPGFSAALVLVRRKIVFSVDNGRKTIYNKHVLRK